MGLIQMDLQSLVLGYMIGIFLMWSIVDTIYGIETDGE
jgi:hypothetical protein